MARAISSRQRSGYGGGKPTAKVIEEYADEWAFMIYNLGITPIY